MTTPTTHPAVAVPADPERVESGRSTEWYALTTRAGRERQTGRALQTVLHRITGVDVVVDVPLERDHNGRSRVRWSGLLLVRLPQDRDWSSLLRSVPGVSGFVGGLPVVLTDDEVARLRAVDATPAAAADLAVGDRAVVNAGPFSGLDLLVTAVGNDRVSGLVNLFGRETSVSVDRDQLRP